ncbi:MAG: serine hydrolase domain-containing protein [Planctomycetota bacterium]|jgi:CubicO group peptidase (beta-lactamase class C family)
MRQPPLFVAALTALAGVAGSASAQPALPEGFADNVSDFARTVMELHEIPGLGIAVTRADEVVYAEAFGVRNIDTGEPLGPENLFHMASVSKPFVATAVVQLAERGKLDLDAPVTTYLPYFELDDPRYSQITIRQMLSHTAGMPDVGDYEWDKPQYDEGAAERYVRSHKDKQLVFAPGEGFRYSNLAYDTLGDLIAKVSGEPFEVYVKKNILDPIGMTESTFLYPETNEALRTTGHIWDLKPLASDIYPYNRRHAPSSTLNSSVREMTNWNFVNLNRGQWNGKRILDEASYELLWAPAVQIGANTHVGLSWFLGEYHGRKIIDHAGGDLGFRSYVTLLPDEDVGIVLASNYSQTPTRALRNGILDILFGTEPQIPRRSIGFVFAQTLAAQGFDAARTQYLQLQAEAADRYEFTDRALNMLGYVMMRRGQLEGALAVFQFNVEQYPDVANCWDSLGEANLNLGNRGEAIRCYRKALDLDPSFENARRALQKLETKL